MMANKVLFARMASHVVRKRALRRQNSAADFTGVVANFDVAELVLSHGSFVSVALTTHVTLENGS